MANDVPFQKNPIQIRKAFHHFKLLTQDVENTDEVFKIIRALTGNSFYKSFMRFRATPHGQKVLAEKRSMLDFLQDRTPLAELPEGTLGRTYHEFMSHENLSADGLAAASEAVREEGDPEPHEEMQIYGNWVRDIHDLYHVSSGYGRDPFGELCLLSFTFAQTRNPGIAFIVFMGALQSMGEMKGVPVWRAVWEAYRNGMRSRWMPAEDWESFLTLPLKDVREKLGIRWPKYYSRGLEIMAQNGPADDEYVQKIKTDPFVPIAPGLAAGA